MKKQFCFIVFCSIVLNSFSQHILSINEDSIISYSDVIHVDSTMSADILFNNAKEWLSKNTNNFNRSNSEKNTTASEVFITSTRANFAKIDNLFKNETPLRFVDKENKKIIGKVVIKYTGSMAGCIRVNYIEFDILLKFKNGRYKYDYTNFNYTHYIQGSAKQSQLYGLRDIGNCKSKGKLEELLKCDKCKNEFKKFYTYINSEIETLIADMKTNLSKISDDDNW